MKYRIVIASTIALVFIAPSANALTVVNTDKAAYSVKITPKIGKTTLLDLKANAKADIECKMGCTLSLANSSQVLDGKTAAIWIRAGKFATK